MNELSILVYLRHPGQFQAWVLVQYNLPKWFQPFHLSQLNGDGVGALGLGLGLVKEMGWEWWSEFIKITSRISFHQIGCFLIEKASQAKDNKKMNYLLYSRLVRLSEINTCVDFNKVRAKEFTFPWPRISSGRRHGASGLELKEWYKDTWSINSRWEFTT